MMTSPIHSENDSYDSGVHSNMRYNLGGVMLLEEAERAPEYLRLTIDSDPDEPDQQVDTKSDDKPDSEEDVVVLGEKRPTYQEITLEEDEEGAVKESVVEKEKQTASHSEKVESESIFLCPKCDRSFRVKSLFEFHFRMHDSALSATNSKTTDSSSSQSSTKHHIHSSEEKPKKKKHSRHKHSVHKEKQKYKHKKPKRSKSM